MILREGSYQLEIPMKRKEDETQIQKFWSAFTIRYKYN